jgi:hypothetical protein
MSERKFTTSSPPRSARRSRSSPDTNYQRVAIPPAVLTASPEDSGEHRSKSRELSFPACLGATRLPSSGGTNWWRSMAGAPSRAGRVRRALRDARGQRRPWPGRDAPRWRRTAAGIVRGFLRSVGSDGLVALTSTGPVVPYWIKSLVRPHRLAQDVALGLRAVDPVVKRGGRVHPPIGDRLPLLAEPGV